MVDFGEAISDFAELLDIIPQGCLFFFFHTRSDDTSLFNDLGLSSSHDELRLSLRTSVYHIMELAHTTSNKRNQMVWFAGFFSICSLINHLGHYFDTSGLEVGAYDEIQILQHMLATQLKDTDSMVSKIIRETRVVADTCNWSSDVTTLIIARIESVADVPNADRKYNDPTDSLPMWRTPLKQSSDRLIAEESISVERFRLSNAESPITTSPLKGSKPPLTKFDFNQDHPESMDEFKDDDAIPTPPLFKLNSGNHLGGEDLVNDEENAEKSIQGSGSALVWKSEEVSNKWNLPF